MMLSRRNLIKTTGATMITAPANTFISRAQTPDITMEASAKLGDPREAFEALFGPGIEQDDDVTYLADEPNVATYQVRFNDQGIAEFILVDFEPLPGNVLEFVESNLGESQFVREDAVADALFQPGYRKEKYGSFAIRAWHSESLASHTGRSGWVTVMDDLGLGEAGMMGPFGITSTRIGMETFEVHEIIPTGEDLGPHSSMDDWIAYNNGEDGVGEAGLHLTVKPSPGDWIINNGSMSFTPDVPLSPSEAAAEIARRLPPAELTWTTWFSFENEETLPGVRLHRFEVPETGELFLAQQVVIGGDEDNGHVARITLVRPDDEVQFPQSRAITRQARCVTR